jgi:hypothetical protein
MKRSFQSKERKEKKRKRKREKRKGKSETKRGIRNLENKGGNKLETRETEIPVQI